MTNLRNRIFLFSIVGIFSFVLIFITIQLLSPASIPANQIINHVDKINVTKSANNPEFSQVIVKKFDPTATPETNIEAIATSNESYILEVCAKNSTNHYDALYILRGPQLLAHFDLINDTNYICTTNSGNAGDKTSISTVNVSGVTNLIVTLRTAANATADISYPG